MSITTEKRRLSSILKPYPSLESPKLNASLSQNKVRFDDLSIESVLQDALENNRLQRFEHLLASIKEEQFDENKFQQVFIDSKRCVHLLNANFGMLVEALLSVKWLSRSDTAQEIYKAFVIELLVAHSNYTSLVVSRLVQSFIPKDDDRSGWVHGVPTEETLRTVAPIHDLIVRLINVIPMLFDVILVHLRKNFPYFKKPTHVVCGFVHNMLCMTEYSSMFVEELLEIIFNRMLVIDVNAPRREIEEAEFPEDEQQIFMMEDDAVAGHNEDEEDVTMKMPLAETLDCCMELLFEYIKKRTSSENTNESDRMFKVLLSLFDNHILPTHNTHHVQFLIFYFCSFKQSYAEYFITYLWKQVCNPNVSTPMRQAAVGYLASMLARAKFVPISLLKSTLLEFSTWVHQYIQETDSMIGCTLKAHMVFYSICQAIFYVVAFRSKHLTASSKNLIFLQSLQLSSIVTCHLNPLRVCLPAVATAFAGVTRAHQLAYCHTILERNARRKLATIYKNEAQTPQECLETFFPFDPYILKKSSQRIDPIFLQYQASETEENHPISSPEARGRKRSESMSEDVDDFLQESKRLKNDQGAPQDFGEMHYTYSYGVSPGFHN
ncbi:RNA polymerase I-specific transcription initiation factor RRN3 [Topomyia yanbarensis]|uniref:RNA polymerase I-specific transcription initiation factor RRN3 n=1 Tax=Topomyia yanbarensis TaxID=2498891 RepID=UPI00273BC91B|nr:RNA polymerase I-specific transcription initiation factor RRN3 [Topomyia yanbarensis]